MKIAEKPTQGLRESIDRFLSKNYTFKSAYGYESEFRFTSGSRFEFWLIKIYQMLTGRPLRRLPASDIFEVFGSNNKSSRQSLRNHFGEHLCLYVSTGENPRTVIIGSWAEGSFKGVETTQALEEEQDIDPGNLQLEL